MNITESFINECFRFCRMYFHEIASADDCTQYCNEFSSSKHVRHVTNNADGSFSNLSIALSILAGPLALIFINCWCSKSVKKTVIFNYVNQAAIFASCCSTMFILAYMTHIHFFAKLGSH